jgi:hypothetical protein
MCSEMRKLLCLAGTRYDSHLGQHAKTMQLRPAIVSPSNTVFQWAKTCLATTTPTRRLCLSSVPFVSFPAGIRQAMPMERQVMLCRVPTHTVGSTVDGGR